MNKIMVANELVKIAKLLTAEDLDGLLEAWFKADIMPKNDIRNLERKMTSIVKRAGGKIMNEGDVNSDGMWTIAYEVPFSKLVGLRDDIMRLPEWKVPARRGGMVKMGP